MSGETITLGAQRTVLCNMFYLNSVAASHLVTLPIGMTVPLRDLVRRVGSRRAFDADSDTS